MIRYTIPLAAILVGLAAFAAQPSEDREVREVAARPSPGASDRVEAEPGPSLESPPAPARAPERPAPVRSVAAPVPLNSVAEPHLVNRPRILFLLERELRLSPDQRRHVESVFFYREQEIESHHRQIRAVGAISGQAYHRHMQELRGRSYGQVEQVLDADQHGRFLELLAAGALNDLIAFPMNDGMVELD